MTQRELSRRMILADKCKIPGCEIVSLSENRRDAGYAMVCRLEDAA